jgi:hypothetical protein
MKWLKASGKKGIQGEKQVARRLRRLDSRQYIVLSDLLLPCGSRLTQIDHVVVSVYGIFVIETKNYHGTISGSIWKEFWVQTCGIPFARIMPMCRHLPVCWGWNGTVSFPLWRSQMMPSYRWYSRKTVQNSWCLFPRCAVPSAAGNSPCCCGTMSAITPA